MGITVTPNGSGSFIVECEGERLTFISDRTYTNALPIDTGNRHGAFIVVPWGKDSDSDSVPVPVTLHLNDSKDFDSEIREAAKKTAKFSASEPRIINLIVPIGRKTNIGPLLS